MSGKKVAAAALLVALAAAAGVWWHYNRAEKAQPYLALYGNIDIRQVALAFNVNGRIARVLAQEGDRVQRGQILAELDTEQLQHAVAEAEARVAAQRCGGCRGHTDLCGCLQLHHGSPLVLRVCEVDGDVSGYSRPRNHTDPVDRQRLVQVHQAK